MTQTKIRSIVCAVRGRPASRDTVTRAVDLALEHQASLTFIHVTNLEFLGMATPAMSSSRTVYNQLHDMAEFTMLILCDRAHRRGVEQVNSIIREGNIPTQLYQFLSENRPDLFVIGEPQQDTSGTLFGDDELQKFIQRLETEFGLQTVVVKPQG